METQIRKMQIGSCNCLTKTPDLQYHKGWCKYRKLGNAIETFEKWFLSLPDVDETLLSKNKLGWYENEDIRFAFVAYCQGLRT